MGRSGGPAAPPAVAAAIPPGQVTQQLHVMVELVRERQFHGADGDLPADICVVGPAIDRLRRCCQLAVSGRRFNECLSSELGYEPEVVIDLADVGFRWLVVLTERVPDAISE